MVLFAPIVQQSTESSYRCWKLYRSETKPSKEQKQNVIERSCKPEWRQPLARFSKKEKQAECFVMTLKKKKNTTPHIWDFWKKRLCEPGQKSSLHIIHSNTSQTSELWLQQFFTHPSACWLPRSLVLDSVALVTKYSNQSFITRAVSLTKSPTVIGTDTVIYKDISLAHVKVRGKGTFKWYLYFLSGYLLYCSF